MLRSARRIRACLRYVLRASYTVALRLSNTDNRALHRMTHNSVSDTITHGCTNQFETFVLDLTVLDLTDGCC